MRRGDVFNTYHKKMKHTYKGKEMDSIGERVPDVPLRRLRIEGEKDCCTDYISIAPPFIILSL